ncbi:hypothetical protein Tco_1126027 [Tanacetum coccineum]
MTPEQIFWSKDENDRKKAETSVPKPLSTPTVYPPNTPVKLVPRVLPTKSQVKINLYTLTQLFTEFDKTCKKRITPTGVTEGERGFEQTKRCYLTEVIPFFKTLKEHFAGVQTALFKEVKVMEGIFDQMSDEVDQNVVDKQCAEIVKKNLLIENENLIANCLSNQLLYDVKKTRCLDLEAEMSKVQNEIKHISKLEREYLNLQLKYQHLQESFDNNKSQASQEAPDFNSFFKIKNLEHQIQEKDNVIRDLKVLVSKMNDRSCEPYNAKDVTDLLEQNERFRAEIEKVKQHYKELFESIKVTRASTNEKTSSLLTQIEDLKAQLEGNLKNATRNSVKTKVLAPGMYAIDVEPLNPHLKNNRGAHLDYLKHLKESVETVREIMKEARMAKPLDIALESACHYTNNLRNCVSTSTEASGSNPRSNTKHDRILPAKSERNSPQENLIVVINGDPQERIFAIGELCPLTRLPMTCCSKLYLKECMAPVRISSGPEPIMTLDLSSSSLVFSSSLGLQCQKTFDQISSNLVSRMSQRRMLASLQAPFLKDKKGVRFSALYLQQKRNLLVLDHSHQQVAYFFHARSVVKWINVDQLALNVTLADSAHPFESPPAGKTDITFTRRRVPSN